MKVSSVAWSLLGLGLPPLAALLFIPPLLSTLGTERFGLLSLIWALTALSGLLDLGIGRATTKIIAGQQANGSSRAMLATASAAVRLTGISGSVGGLLIASTLLVDLRSALRVQEVSSTELINTTLLLAFMVPSQALAATYRGIAEGLQCFRGISLIRMSLGVANFGAPWLVARFTTNLSWAVASLLITRLLALAAFALIKRNQLPADGRDIEIEEHQQRQRELLSAGGWLSVSAVVSPLLVQADRFAIAAIVSAAAVTAYALPFDIITQLLIIPSAIAAVALPSLSGQIAAAVRQAKDSFRQWTVAVALLMAGLTGITALVLPAALSLWLGRAVSDESISVGRWICLGVWLNSIGAMHYTWLHAHGRFRATAMLHLIELPLYALMLTTLLHWHGVVGAAIAWVLRVSADTLGLYALSRQHDPEHAT